MSFYSHCDALLADWVSPMLVANGGAIASVQTEYFLGFEDLPAVVADMKFGLPAIMFSVPFETIGGNQLSEGAQRTRSPIVLSYSGAIVTGGKQNVVAASAFHGAQRDLLLRYLHGRLITAAEYPTVNGLTVTGDRALIRQVQMRLGPGEDLYLTVFTLDMKWNGWGGAA